MSEFRMTNALGDHMVLQRDADVCLWGKGKRPGMVVYAVFGPYEGWGQVGEDLTWALFLPPMPACTVPQTLILSDGEEKLEYKDILVGDVWVINGQSNADLTMAGANSNGAGIYDEEMEDISKKDLIRAIKQSRGSARWETMQTPQFDLSEPKRSTWRPIAKKADTEDLSALAYFFGRELSRSLNASVPIGLVTVASGGSPMMELIMPELVEPMGYTKPEKENVPLAGIYNALMAPVQNMSIKGMLFYQGESEQWRYKKYPYQLKWYVEELRRRFGFEFPFYFVQLSSHVGVAETAWPKLGEVRFAQTKTLDILDNCHMIVSMDVGGRTENKDWAHPPYKKPLGERAAKCVLANEYGIGDPDYATSPLPCCADFEEGKVTVEFDFVGDALIVKGDKLIGFELMDDKDKWHKATAKVTGEDTVTVRGVKNAVAVRYGYPGNAEACNLFSSTMLPAAAFELYKNENGLLR